MADETWRVVLESGEVLAVLVWQGVVGGYYATHDGMEVRRALDANPRAAICTLAGHGSWPVREILAPGDASRTEAVAIARDREHSRCLGIVLTPVANRDYRTPREVQDILAARLEHNRPEAAQ